mgnify:CR=1 FL=1
MELRWVYITCKNRDQALHIGRLLVESRLAACANVMESMHSLYWWQGEVVEDQEAVLIVKARAAHLDLLIKAVKSAHSYETPCIVALPILEGNPDYLAWLAAETEHPLTH